MPTRKWPKYSDYFFRRLGGRHRIERDDQSRSARQRCFDYFDQGKRPAEVRGLVPEVKKATVLRYFEDWKKLGKDFSMRHRQVRAYLKQGGDLSACMIKTLSEELEMPPVEVVARLHKPWGIHQLLTGKWGNYRKERVRNQAEQRLRWALTIVRMLETLAAGSREDAGAMVQDLVYGMLEALKEKEKEQKGKDETG